MGLRHCPILSVETICHADRLRRRSRHKKGVDTGDKRGYDGSAGIVQLHFAQLWGRWGVYVKQSVNRWSRIALAAVLTGALGLAACGRKGPLDPPPSAGLTSNTAYTPRPGMGEEHYGSPPGAAASPPAAAAAPAAPPPQQKTFFLDFLLGK
jgi:predicted small lipoprotein YifL